MADWTGGPAQLVDGASGEQLWARRYDRRLDDFFASADAALAICEFGTFPGSKP